MCPTFVGLQTPWTAASQASLSITNSRSSLRLTSIESVMPSSHLVLCRPLLFLPSIFPSVRAFSNVKSMNHFSITDAPITSHTISLFGSHTKSVSQANLKGLTVRHNCVHNHVPHKEEPITPPTDLCIFENESRISRRYTTMLP